MIYKCLNYFSSEGTPFGARIKLIGLIPPSHSQIILEPKEEKNRKERKRNLQALLRRKDG